MIFLKNLTKYILFLAYTLVIVVLGMEVVLRFFFPVPRTISSAAISLPKNQKYVLSNTSFTKLSKNGIHTKNNIGFRGPDFKNDIKGLKILAIGGSTTECFYTDDKNTWTNLLSEKLRKSGKENWINNAGLNGHSSFGHLKLSEGILPLVKPDVAIFLLGINDLMVAETANNPFDNNFLNGSFVNTLTEYSRFVNYLLSAYRSYKAYKFGISDKLEWRLKADYSQVPKANFEPIKKYLPQYEDRILSIVKLCKQQGVTPIFVTQPLLLGKGIDPETNVNLEKQVVYGINGKDYAHKLELLNQTLIKVCQKNNVEIIDLASLLPKNSKYYFDDMHFSDNGNEKVAQLIFENLKF